MADRDVPWKVWAVIMLSGAIITSPLLVRILEQAEFIKRDNPLTPQQPLRIEAKVSVDANASAAAALPPPANGYLPPAQTQPSVAQAQPSVPDVAPVRSVSSHYLSAADLVRLSNWELDVLRNEIYARHGRRFRRPELQSYFDGQPWYTPRYAPDAFPEEILSAVERYNVELIASYQRGSH